MNRLLRGIVLSSLCVFSSFIFQLFYFSPISPDSLPLPSSSPSSFPSNNHLKRVIKLGDGLLKDPEDVCVDKNGVVYTATRDGWIKRMHINGSWENWKEIGSDSLVGITLSKQGHLLVCDAQQGLLKVSDDGVTLLASHVNGSPIRLPDDVIEARDGSVYFSDASTKFGFHEWYLDFLEAKPHGRLVKYDPVTKQTLVLLQNLSFPNGVALSMDEDYLLVCETFKCRCLKYWLKGENEGKIEVFIDNLPGGPDNINLAPDGSFWIATLKMGNHRLSFVQSFKVYKHFLAAYPRFMKHATGIYKSAMVVNVATNGKIVRMFDDRDGEVMNFVTSAFEFEDHLYLGSLNSQFIGKLSLKELDS